MFSFSFRPEGVGRVPHSEEFVKCIAFVPNLSSAVATINYVHTSMWSTRLLEDWRSAGGSPPVEPSGACDPL